MTEFSSSTLKTDSSSIHLEICYIGLGSNLNQPINQILSAIKLLENSKLISLVKASPLYKSAPMGPQDQDDYINAVVKIETTLSPIDLLDYLQSIERDYGRVRNKEQWSARTLDLDLLLYADKQINQQRLTVPHYGIAERAFVLYPLFDVAKDLVFPNRTHIKKLVKDIEITKPRIKKLSKEAHHQ